MARITYKAIILTLFSVFVPSAQAQFPAGGQSVRTCSDGPAFYAEVNTHAYSVYKVFGYSAGGKLVEQKPDVINVWVGMNPYPQIFPLKKVDGGGYLYTTNSRSIFPYNAEMAFFRDNEWDNNGGYKMNYHPFAKCETAYTSSNAGMDNISSESWTLILEKLAQLESEKTDRAGQDKAQREGGKCVDNTGGHANTDCAGRVTEFSCRQGAPHCRWISLPVPPQPHSTDH